MLEFRYDTQLLIEGHDLDGRGGRTAGKKAEACRKEQQKFLHG